MPSQVGGLIPGAISPRIGRAHPGRVIGVEVDRLDRMRSPTGGSSSYAISGTTRDSNSNALGNCNVRVFITGADVLYTRVVSDANGKWSALVPDKTTTYYAVSDEPISGVTGVTVTTLVGS